MASKHIKICSISLVNRKMEIKIVATCHYIAIRMTIIIVIKSITCFVIIPEDVEPSDITDGNVKLCYFGKQY